MYLVHYMAAQVKSLQLCGQTLSERFMTPQKKSLCLVTRLYTSAILYRGYCKGHQHMLANCLNSSLNLESTFLQNCVSIPSKCSNNNSKYLSVRLTMCWGL